VRPSATPIIIDKQDNSLAMERLALGKGNFDEAWLQNQVQQHPYVLPVSEIEPGFGDLIAIAMEVPVPQGFIDNVFITPNGNVVFTELKLWRNPQARREVVAQSLDYIAGLSGMSYSEFEHACLTGKLSKDPPPESLYDFVRDVPDALSEPEFIDAVSKNLKRGRILAIAAGDGIRSESETLSNLLQEYASAQFTFALVKLAVYKCGSAHVIMPSTLSQTQMIKRYVFVPSSDKDEVRKENKLELSNDTSTSSISSEQFFEAMEKRKVGLSNDIKNFLKKLEVLDIYPEYKASLNFKHERPTASNPYNLGYITQGARFITSPAGWWDFLEIGREYHSAVADIIGGSIKAGVKDGKNEYATIDGKTSPHIDMFLPDHADALFEAMKVYLKQAMEIDNQ